MVKRMSVDFCACLLRFLFLLACFLIQVSYGKCGWLVGSVESLLLFSFVFIICRHKHTDLILGSLSHALAGTLLLTAFVSLAETIQV